MATQTELQGLKQAVEYLWQNKDRYVIEKLKEQLRKLGYPENVIAAATEKVYLGTSKEGLSSEGKGVGGARQSFFDFRSKKVYRSLGEKVLDFFVGFFGILVLFWIFVVIAAIFGIHLFSFGPLPGTPFFVFAVQIFGIFYFWKRRRFLARGLLSAILIPLLLAGVVIAYVFLVFKVF